MAPKTQIGNLEGELLLSKVNHQLEKNCVSEPSIRTKRRGIKIRGFEDSDFFYLKLEKSWATNYQAQRDQYHPRMASVFVGCTSYSQKRATVTKDGVPRSGSHIYISLN